MPNRTIDKPTTALITVMLFAFLVIIGARVGEHYDHFYWEWWATAIFKHGLSNVYATSDTNYMPFIQYVLYVYAKCMGSVSEIARHTAYLKVVPIAFNFLGLWYIYRFIDKSKAFLAVLLINVLNLGFSFNSVIWGQYDAVLSTLNFIAIYYAYNNKMVLSTVFYIISFNMKVQAIVLLPVFGLFYLNNILIHKNLKAVLYPILAAIIVQLLFLVPFLSHPANVKLIWDVVVNSASTYPKVSMEALNIWNILLHPINPREITDDGLFIGNITYKRFGLVMFFIASFVALFPLLKTLFQRVAGKSAREVSAGKLMLICGLLYISFYYFNTQMHERYADPAMIFIVAYAFYKKKYFIYILFSFANLVTMERVFKWMDLNNYEVFVFNPLVIASLFGVIMLAMFYLLYKKEDDPAMGLQG